jgi:uncharacterized protein
LAADGLIVAFSGGVDSAFLLWAAEQVRRETGGRVLALSTMSASLSSVDREDARQFAAELGVEHVWEESFEVSNPAYARNDGNRCYHCKTELFRIAHDVAAERGFRWLAYGYNASDRDDVRPGHRAAIENEVLSPLAEAGLTKEEIRALMRDAGLSLSDKPASPCLSSRLMVGVGVTADKLGDVEALETLLRGAGVGVFRVRVHEEGARKYLRVEVQPDEMAKVLAVRAALVSEGERRGYHWVTLDLAGYRVGGGT